MYHRHVGVPATRRDDERVLVVGAVAVLLGLVLVRHLQPAAVLPGTGSLTGLLLVGVAVVLGAYRARWGLGRIRSTVRFDMTGAVLLPAALLLSPIWFPVIAAAASLDREARHTVRNTAVRTLALAAAALACGGVADGFPGLAPLVSTPGLPALILAGIALLSTETALHYWHLVRVDGTAHELRGLVSEALSVDGPAITLGILGCILVAADPAALVLLLPLLVLVHLRLRNHELLLEAGRDAKTGLLRLDTFRPLADAEIARARRHARPLTAVMLDLDSMKSVNILFGHLTGEAVIASLGSVLAANSRAEDVLARFGGDEFCLLLPDTDLWSGLVIAERLRATIADTVVVPSRPTLRRTASLGLAELTEHDTLDDLLGRADAALVRAKSGGRNQIVVDDPMRS